MVQHLAQARLTLARESIVIPAFERAVQELHPRHDRKRLASIVAVPLVRGLSVLGLSPVRREALEQLEYLLQRGVVAGASDLGNYLEQEIIEHVFRNTAIFTPPANVYVALWTAATGEANDSGTEVSGGSYAREAVGTTSGWDAPTDGATANAADVDFGTATADWGTVSHVSLEDASASPSNRFFHGALTASKTVNNGDSFKFATGDLDVSVA